MTQLLPAKTSVALFTEICAGSESNSSIAQTEAVTIDDLKVRAVTPRTSAQTFQDTDGDSSLLEESDSSRYRTDRTMRR